MRTFLTKSGSLTKSMVFVCAWAILMQAFSAHADTLQDDDYVDIRTRKLNGPRIGLTYVPDIGFLRGNGEFIKGLKENEIGSLISQFGWHFEWLVTPQGGGPSFVTQVVPFLGGVEYMKVIPSVSLVLGVRMPKGFELGLGPNVFFNVSKLIDGDDIGNPLTTSLIMAFGKSVDFSGVSIPLNLAVATNNQGTRISFVFGYAIGQRS